MSRAGKRQAEKRGHLNCFTHKYATEKMRRLAIHTGFPYRIGPKHRAEPTPHYGFFRGIWEAIKSFFWTDYK